MHIILYVNIKLCAFASVDFNIHFSSMCTVFPYICSVTIPIVPSLLYSSPMFSSQAVAVHFKCGISATVSEGVFVNY